MFQFINCFCLCCSAVTACICLFSCFLTCSLCCYLSFIPPVSCSFKMISIIFTDMLMLVIICFNPAAPFMACRRDFFECRIVTSCAGIVCIPACFRTGRRLSGMLLDVVIQLTESFRLYCGCCFLICFEDFTACFAGIICIVSVFRTSCCLSVRLRKVMSGCRNCLCLRCFAGCAGIGLYAFFFAGCRSRYRSVIPIMPCIAVFFIAAFVLTCMPVL